MFLCPNCGEPESHFVGPSLREGGFYTCKNKRDAEIHARIDKVEEDIRELQLIVSRVHTPLG